MKKVLIALAGVLALFTATALPAAAIPADISGVKFWSASRTLSPVGVCVDGSAIDGPYYKVAQIAQAWNVAVNSPNFALNYEADCAAAGYPPSRRFVIGIFTNTGLDNCLYRTNDHVDSYNGLYRWTQGPGIYMNTAADCLSGQIRRDHEVSLAIGYIMGLQVVDGAGWTSRVMCSCTRDLITMPDSFSATTLRNLYAGAYGG